MEDRVKQELLEGIKHENYMTKFIRKPLAAGPRMDCPGRSRETNQEALLIIKANIIVAQ